MNEKDAVAFLTGLGYLVADPKAIVPSYPCKQGHVHRSIKARDRCDWLKSEDHAELVRKNGRALGQRWPETEEKQAKFFKMYDSGMRKSEIARSAGLSSTYVAYLILREWRRLGKPKMAFE